MYSTHFFVLRISVFETFQFQKSFYIAVARNLNIYQKFFFMGVKRKQCHDLPEILIMKCHEKY